MTYGRFVGTRWTVVIAALAMFSAARATAQVDAFFDNFSNGNVKGWTLDATWQIGSAVPSVFSSCGATGDPATDADGTLGGGLAGVVIGGLAGTAPHPAYSLTSPPIWLAPGTQATLSFSRWLQSDYLPFMSSSIDVYDGSNWISIFQNANACIVDTSWQSISYDVSAYANPAFRVRFSYAASSNAYNMPSWSIDNVRVTIPTTSTTRFADKFSNGNARGWTMDTDWQIGGAITGPAWACSNFGDPGSDADGVAGGGIAGVLIGGNTDPTIQHADYSLTSPIIHLTPGKPATLSFSRWLGCDYSPFMTSTVSVFNGASWHTIYFSPSYCLADSAWTPITFDVTAYANPNFRFRFSYAILNAGSYASPSWNIDNVSLSQSFGQSNTAAASLTVNGTGPVGGGGPFAENITNAGGLNLIWNGTPNMPVILAGSINEGSHSDLSGLGLIGIGTAPTYSDVFVIFDGLSFPGSLYATLDSTGLNTMSLSTAGIPLGSEFFIQGLVGQFTTGSPAPFTFTAAHKLTKL